MILFGMTLVTYLPRLVPIWFLSGRKLPEFLTTWLRYVGVAVLAAMMVPSVTFMDGKLSLNLDNLYLLAAIPTILVAWKTRSMFASVLFGMLLVAAVRYFGGV